MGLGIFPGRVYEHIIIVNILGFIILYFLFGQRLLQSGFPALAAPHQYQFLHILSGIPAALGFLSPCNCAYRVLQYVFHVIQYGLLGCLHLGHRS